MFHIATVLPLVGLLLILGLANSRRKYREDAGYWLLVADRHIAEVATIKARLAECPTCAACIANATQANDAALDVFIAQQLAAPSKCGNDCQTCKPLSNLLR